MIPLIKNPKVGQWYLSVTCDKCNSKLLVFRDLNNGEGYVDGVFVMTCPHCKCERTLPIEHYQHRERRKPDICIEIL